MCAYRYTAWAGVVAACSLLVTVAGAVPRAVQTPGDWSSYSGKKFILNPAGSQYVCISDSSYFGMTYPSWGYFSGGSVRYKQQAVSSDVSAGTWKTSDGMVTVGAPMDISDVIFGGTTTNFAGVVTNQLGQVTDLLTVVTNQLAQIAAWESFWVAQSNATLQIRASLSNLVSQTFYDPYTLAELAYYTAMYSEEIAASSAAGAVDLNILRQLAQGTDGGVKVQLTVPIVVDVVITNPSPIVLVSNADPRGLIVDTMHVEDLLSSIWDSNMIPWQNSVAEALGLFAGGYGGADDAIPAMYLEIDKIRERTYEGLMVTNTYRRPLYVTMVDTGSTGSVTGAVTNAISEASTASAVLEEGYKVSEVSGIWASTYSNAFSKVEAGSATSNVLDRVKTWGLDWTVPSCTPVASYTFQIPNGVSDTGTILYTSKTIDFDAADMAGLKFVVLAVRAILVVLIMIAVWWFQVRCTMRVLKVSFSDGRME